MNFDAIPIAGIFAGTVIVVMAAIELGHRLGLANHRRGHDDKDSATSTISGAILGLAGFMLAFTFAIVAERYDARKGLVREDANAIRTAWQRSDFLPEQERGEAGALLREYVDLRVKFATGETLGAVAVQTLLVDTQRLQGRLWDMAVVNARKDMNSDVAAMYIDSLNEVTEIHASRIAVGLQARIPWEIWLVLYFVTILGMLAVGYQTGVAGAKRSIARPIIAFSFSLSFALVFALIAALDRPDSGILSVTQQPLIDLHDSMAAASERAR
jgi:hypothetical protein